MKIKVISSGSDGNAYVITDNKRKQLLVECGLVIKKLLREIDLNNLQGCIVSHEHKDHSIATENLRRFSVNVYDNTNMQAGKSYRIGDYRVFPIQSQHNVPCFGFIISSVNEQKKILFATDTYEIDPHTPDIQYDLAMLECNYSEPYANKEDEGFYNHMSCERLQNWLETRQYKSKALCLIHLSTRGNLGDTDLNAAFKQHCERLYVAKKGLEFEI